MKIKNIKQINGIDYFEYVDETGVYALAGNMEIIADAQQRSEMDLLIAIEKNVKEILVTLKNKEGGIV